MTVVVQTVYSTMDTVQRILRLHGFESVEDMDFDDTIKLEVDGVMPLTIERVSDRRVSVAHYYRQNHDLMRDPEIVFEVTDDGGWVAVEYVQDPFVYKHDENGLDSATAFALNTWDETLEQQGFVEAARAAASSTSPRRVTA